MRPEDIDSLDSRAEFITFSAGDQAFCIEIDKVLEIRRWTQVTALPHMPSDVLGVINLRGNVTPIVDVSAKFSLGQTEADERNVIIIATVKGKNIGLLVQSVSEILSRSPEEIQDSKEIDSLKTSPSISGVLSNNSDLVKVVNPEFIADI